MVELAVTDGMPPPTDLPRGEVICTRLDDGSIRVDRADPRVLISADLLDLIHVAQRIPCVPPATSDIAVHVHLEERPLQASMETPVTYVGAVLKIHGVNRTAVYRIVDYAPRVNAYVAEWPD